MDIEIKSASDEAFEEFVKADYRAFGEHPKPEELEAIRKVFEPGRSFAAYDGSRIVGTTATATMALSVPGGQIQMAGVTGVGVGPTHRRRGILTQMMRHQLADTRDRGEAIAGLWASESVIYGRFGYGVATYALDIEIQRHRTGFVRPFEDPGQVRLVEKAEALDVIVGAHERFRVGQPGAWARTPPWWEHELADLEHWRDGASALWFAMHETAGDPDGFAIYRIKHDWSGPGPNARLKVRDLFAENRGAYEALWRYCFGVDLVGTVEAWPRSIDEPLFHMLADPRHLNLKVSDGLWLRVVDVPAALAARRYHAEGRLVLDVRDAFCPWVEGRYELEAGPDGAECRPTDREPDVVVSAADLGASYLGGARFGSLARAGRVEETSPGALGKADAMFYWDPPPWCPAVF